MSGYTRHRLFVAFTVFISTAVSWSCGTDQREARSNIGSDTAIGDAAVPDATPRSPCDGVECADGESCYRGACRSDCQSDDDCSDGNRCVAGTCTPDDCSDLTCGDSESCHRGRCHADCDPSAACTNGSEGCCPGGASCVEVGDCADGPCETAVCRELANPTVATGEPTDITTTSTTLNGELEETGVPTPSAHGFCIDTVPDPTREDSDCRNLEGRSEPGSFSLEVDELSRGEVYFVRAFATNQAGTSYGDDVRFATLSAAPSELTASSGEHAEHVRLSWSGAVGADEYRIYRDGEAIDTTPSTNYEDTGAEEGGAPEAPSPTATSGEHADRVVVSWSEPNIPDGSTHSYHVVAVNDSGESEQSNTAEGYRSGYPVDRYEVRVDGGDWTEVGESTQWADTSPPPQTVADTGTPSASKGTSTSYVELQLSGISLEAGASASYEVRAVNETDPGTASDPADGHVGAGEPSIQWQRSADDSDGNYSNIPGGTLRDYNDTGAPADGTGRYYRAVVTPPLGTPETTDPVRGFRANEPVVETVGASNTTTNATQVDAKLLSTGAPSPSAHGVCWGTSQDPTRQNATCKDLGGNSSSGDFSVQIDGLTAGGSYHVRAFATNNAGTVYGSDLEFTTVPPAPTGLVATDGTSSDYVELSWNDTTGADEYEVYRDGSQIGTVGNSSYNDTGADEGGTPEAPSVTATSGTHTDRVALSWNAPSVPDGTTHTYKVVAVNDSGSSDDSPTADGYRDGYPVTSYEIYRDGSQIDTATTTSYDDTGADEGGTPDAPSLSATSGAHTDRVALDWNQPAVPDGTTHSYTLVAVNDSGPSAESSTADGYRDGYPVTAYEVRVDGGSWMDVGQTTSWDDTGADDPSIALGTANASDGTQPDYVALDLSSASTDPGDPSTYEVRALNDTGQGATSSPADGYIGVGALSLQWQRSAADSDTNYSDIAGATSKTHQDTGAPSDGSWRYYRVTATADGAPTATSNADRGRRMRDEPIAGGGKVIWQHDFTNGMPAEFNHSASYPDSGTWGRAHDYDGGNVYEPASMSGDHLHLNGPSCTYEGTAYPRNVSRTLQNWELTYRVDARPGSTGHADRTTGGIGCVGCEPKGNYNDDDAQFGRGRSGFIGTSDGSNGDKFELRGWDASGDRVNRDESTGGIAISSGEWYVRIATSKKQTKTWVKYWQAGNSEPSSWDHEFTGVYLSGRPGFYVIGTCKGNSRDNYYRFYELREIDL